MSGELNFRTTEKKHELTTWDCKLNSFHAHHKADVQKMASSYKMTYILAAGEALFTKFNQIREEARKASTPFDDDPNNWISDDQVKTLSDYFYMDENGRIITRISIVRSTLLKNTFSTTDVTNFKVAFYASEEKMQAAMKTAVQDYFIEMNKLLINKWRESAFPPGKDDGAAHKELLRAILYAPEITKLINGATPKNVGNWLDMPWLMPAVQIWFRILLRYEGVTENVNANFVQEYQETIGLGLKSAGNSKLHIGEIDRRLKHHLDAAQKAFTTVDGMCEHLRVCCLMAIIKDGASGT